MCGKAKHRRQHCLQYLTFLISLLCVWHGMMCSPSLIISQVRRLSFEGLRGLIWNHTWWLKAVNQCQPSFIAINFKPLDPQRSSALLCSRHFETELGQHAPRELGFETLLTKSGKIKQNHDYIVTMSQRDYKSSQLLHYSFGSLSFVCCHLKKNDLCSQDQF